MIEKASQFRSVVCLFTTTLGSNSLKFKPSISPVSIMHEFMTWTALLKSDVMLAGSVMPRGSAIIRAIPTVPG